ncbi:uncharacterized protein HaLaN_13300, partial [Haematococcus lacustris]
MGDGQQRALPTDYGLGQLWGQDSVTATVWYEVPVSSLPPGANITAVVMRDKVTSGMYIKLPDNTIVQLLARHEEMSLWEMGNMMFANMDEVWRLATNVSASGRQLDSWPPFRNSVDSTNVLILSERYMDTMDAMVQIVGDRAVALDKMLLIAMGAKGVALTLVLTLVLWSLAQRVGGQRYMIYSLFMVLPVGLVRGLATAKHNLEADGQEDEDDDMLAIAAGEASGGSEAVRPREAPRASEPGAHLGAGYSSTGQMTLNIPSLKTASAQERRTPDSPLLLRVAKQLWGALVALCMPWLTPHQVAGAKRQLIPSNRQAVYLTWPLLLWGLIVIITSIITHKELITVQSSIFVYNSVNFVSLIAKISLYTWQELLVVEDVAVATQLRQQLSVSHKRVELEYNVLLYGNMGTPCPWLAASAAPTTSTAPAGHHLLLPMRCMFSAALQSLFTHLPGCGAGLAFAAMSLALPLPLVGWVSSAACSVLLHLLRLAGGGVLSPGSKAAGCVAAWGLWQDAGGHYRASHQAPHWLVTLLVDYAAGRGRRWSAYPAGGPPLCSSGIPCVCLAGSLRAAGCWLAELIHQHHPAPPLICAPGPAHHLSGPVGAGGGERRAAMRASLFYRWYAIIVQSGTMKKKEESRKPDQAAGPRANGANTSIPHFANAGPGLASLGGRGTDLLFSMTGCMRANQSSCLPPTSPYYGDVTNGIDRWFNKMLTIDDTLMMMNDTQPGMGSSVMEWLWLVNNDRADSMTLINLLYQDKVLS